MTAVIVWSASSWTVAWSMGGFALVAGLWLLIQHWGAPKVKRLTAAALVAGVLTTPAVLRAADDEFVMLNVCDRYEPWSIPWIYYLCWSK